MRSLLFTIFIGTSLILTAGNDNNTIGARKGGVGGSSLFWTDHWAVDNNPAAMAFIKDWGAGVAYENRFQLNELSYRSAVLAKEVNKGAFGVSVNQFGYTAFLEERIGLSYGQKLSDYLSLGIQMNYRSTKLGEGYGSQNALSGNVGLLARINDELLMAAYVVNPNRAKRSRETAETYPTLIKLGAAYQFSKKVDLLSEFEKDIDREGKIIIGVEYRATDIFHLRAGYGSNPALSTFGFGLRLQNFQIDFASTFDSRLGFSPQVSISYTPSRNRE